MEVLWNVLAFAIVGLLLFALVRTLLTRHVVRIGHVGLLYSKESFVEVLQPGTYWRVDPFGHDTVVPVSTVPTALNPSQYDVISKDQFAFRINLAPLVTIHDPRAFHEGTQPISDDLGHLYSTLDFRFSRLSPVLAHGAMAAVAAKTLEEFLADPQDALAGLTEDLAEVLPGSTLDRIAITSIQLPPEVRKMFTEVERARREGLAALERARAEQTSLRALANAARNLAGNPELAQLRMLQTMESAKGAKTFVLGNPPELSPDADVSKG